MNYSVTGADTITSIDIQNMIEAGLQIVRFRMAYITRGDKVKILDMLEKATRWCCEKYNISVWPIAISIDLPNASIRTGTFSKVGDLGVLF